MDSVTREQRTQNTYITRNLVLCSQPPNSIPWSMVHLFINLLSSNTMKLCMNSGVNKYFELKTTVKHRNKPTFTEVTNMNINVENKSARCYWQLFNVWSWLWYEMHCTYTGVIPCKLHTTINLQPSVYTHKQYKAQMYKAEALTVHRTMRWNAEFVSQKLHEWLYLNKHRGCVLIQFQC